MARLPHRTLLRETRTRLGALILDSPRYVRDVVLRDRWYRYCNRNDSAEFRSDPDAVRLRSRATSSLHLCEQFPAVGRHLMRRAVKHWPIELADRVQFSEAPQISVLIPHRGSARRDLLEATIRSFAACDDVAVECIVIEQSAEPELADLPANTRYVHAPNLPGESRWHKTMAYNVGARHARGEVLICHDGDIAVPRRYPAEVWRLMESRGIEVAFCQRFLFYLSEASTRSLLAAPRPAVVESCALEQIRQNWVGGTLAIRRAAYARIGGFDEKFLGWTGEDTEFHDRCLALDGWFSGYIPFVHLWHAPQSERVQPEHRIRAEEFTRAQLAIPREQRIRELTSLDSIASS